LGPHATFIVAAYAAAVIVLAVTLAWVWLDYRAQQRVLRDLERQGVTRRSTQANTP
jgi:heme exporter protein D